jgi:HAD superfamily hydrolase (TIGR01509 family)
MLRGIFFDLDNTLIRSRQAECAGLAAGWNQTFGARPALDLERLEKCFRSAYEARFAYGTPGYAELACLPLAEFNRRVTTDALATLGIHDADSIDSMTRACAEAVRRQLAIVPGATETLTALRAAGLKLGLITNGPSAVQRDKLAALALATSFDLIVIDTEFGHPKPDPRIFQHAAEAVELPQSDLLFVGDNFTDDVGGARAAGWLGVWYNPKGSPPPPGEEPPDYTVRDLTEILTLAPVKTIMTQAPLQGCRNVDR